MASVNLSTGQANLILSYNTRYNVSVVADICGRINATTSYMANYGKHILTLLNPHSPFPPKLGLIIIQSIMNLFVLYTCHFYTVNCGPPGLDESTSSVLVMGGTNVALQGDNITFSCSSGLVLAGPNMSICTGNGKWEPDPIEVACIDSSKYYYASYLICRAFLSCTYVLIQSW